MRISHSFVKTSGYILILVAALLFSSDAIARGGGGDVGARAADFNPQRIFPVNSQTDIYYQNQFNPNTQEVIYPKKQALKNAANCLQYSADGTCAIEIQNNN